MTQDVQSPSLFRRALRRTGILLLTTATIGGAGYAVLLGSQTISARASAVEIAEVAEPLPVTVRALEREDGYTVTRRFTGQVEAAQTTDLSFEFGGRMAEITVDEGDIVEEGDVIARLDTALLETERRRLEAARDALVAQREFARLSTERRAELSERGFASTEAFDQARFSEAELTARIAETDAGIAEVDVRLEKSVLEAPFSGRVGARGVDLGTTVSAGAPVISLLEEATPRVRIGLPVWLEPQDTALIEIAGRTYEGELHSVRPDIDPVTRTRTALFDLARGSTAAFGETATLIITREVEEAGTWVPVRALREGAQGLWTVLVVDDEDRVRSAAVELIHTEAERAYVRGTFEDGTRLISAGPHRVTPGQLVRPIAEGA
ncbi:efflux RND transporter periplasmic adaptor subunit [Pontivivens ytuae]|uniref:Efflux RND transporter periplasmic adaptor subunit n=1 Tax=Pontivivens ytuae TaxID=2789856 RepID=A0A7S9LRZ1_9RHOB|nr:efflux RND transporter periplasmic adaptor subunit [Pontivivens ytuae]QPH53640.1 efflux RND transporter periplasmic adaptor subunit [Pontivivens ytuae]